MLRLFSHPHNEAIYHNSILWIADSRPEWTSSEFLIRDCSVLTFTKQWTILFLRICLLERETATHSSALAWRIPGTAEPGGLPSMGSRRVGHDWSDLAAARIYLTLKSSDGENELYRSLKNDFISDVGGWVFLNGIRKDLIIFFLQMKPSADLSQASISQIYWIVCTILEINKMS